MLIPQIKLKNGQVIPQEGFGVYQIPDPDQCFQVVKTALQIGYRSIDTAQAYRNEAAVGQAIASASLSRAELFLTTKVWISNYGEGKTYQSVIQSLHRLRTNYVDLIFLHEPYNDFYGAWRDLIKLQQEGKVRALGLSNFNGAQIVDLAHNTGVGPDVVQLETNLYNQQQSLRQLGRQLGYRIEAWAPLGEGKFSMLADPVATNIAKRHGKSVAQIILRFLVQLGLIIIPRSVQARHLQDNLAIWDFALTETEMSELQKLDRGHGITWDRTQPQVAEHYMKLIDKGL